MLLKADRLGAHIGLQPAELKAGCQSDAFGMEFRPSSALLALQVDDVLATRERLEAAGIEFRGDIIDSGVCHQAYFADPDGNVLAIHHRYAE